MKLPSIELLTGSLIQIIKRFPFVLLAALCGTAVSITLIAHNFGGNNETVLSKILMCSSLGLPLFFAVHIFCERTMAKALFKFAAIITALFVLVQFYYSLSGWEVNDGVLIYRYFFWSAGLHLLVAFSAFFIADELNGFWQFNKQLFLRFLTAALYSGVLYLGLAGAILAVQELFNVHIEGKVYAELWVTIAGMFNTIFFLGGISEPVNTLNEETSYPKGLKIFTQYVLIPLVTIYLLILYAYTGKILMQMNLPKGWVANLILGFSVTGILSLLLVYPIREEEENKWIKTFSRFYYFSLVPLIVLLFVAIGTRISTYGVTIERYIVAMLGTWLAIITLYFIFSKKKNIILIPLTLSVFLFGSCFGPWGMFKVSERSQLKRLHALLEKNGAFVGDKIVTLSDTAAEKVSAEDRYQINSILDYLSSTHGFEGMKDWFSEDCGEKIFKDSVNRYRHEKSYAIQHCIGIGGYANYRDAEDETAVATESSSNVYCSMLNDAKGIDVSGYDRLYHFSDDDYNSLKDGESKNDSYTKLQGNKMTFYIKGEKQFELQLDSIARKLKAVQHNEYNKYNYTATAEEMTFEITDLHNRKVKLLFSSFDSIVTTKAVEVNSINGYLLMKKK